MHAYLCLSDSGSIQTHWMAQTSQLYIQPSALIKKSPHPLCCTYLVPSELHGLFCEEWPQYFIQKGECGLIGCIYKRLWPFNALWDHAQFSLFHPFFISSFLHMSILSYAHTLEKGSNCYPTPADSHTNQLISTLLLQMILWAAVYIYTQRVCFKVSLKILHRVRIFRNSK